MLIHKPEELSWEQAAGIPEVSLAELDTESSLQAHGPLPIDVDNGHTSHVSHR